MIKNDAKEALKKGTTLEGKNFRYRIVDVLGLGSFGITYLADIINADGEPTNMQVALKELFIAECNDRKAGKVEVFNNKDLFDEFRRKFSREADNLHKIHHHNIINVSESFEANDTVYYSMAYIPGDSLKDVIVKKGKISEREALEVAEVLSDALHELHSVGLMHLDLHPGNILMNGGKVPVIVDFGLAKHFNDNGEPDTSIGLGVGTAGFAPMEQAAYKPGNGLPAHIDVYSLGATLYNMLTGTEPPTASEIFNYGFPADELSKAGVSERTSKLVERAMQPLWKDRFPSMSQMEKAIRIILNNEEGPEATEDSAIEENSALPSIPSMTPAEDDERTSIVLGDENTSIATNDDEKTAIFPTGNNEATSFEIEATSVDMPSGPGLPVANPVMPPMMGGGIPPQFPSTDPTAASRKRKRIGAIALIAGIVAFIAVLFITDIYTGWARDLMHRPVETVVLEGDDSSSDIEIEVDK